MGAFYKLDPEPKAHLRRVKVAMPFGMGQDGWMWECKLGDGQLARASDPQTAYTLANIVSRMNRENQQRYSNLGLTRQGLKPRGC